MGRSPLARPAKAAAPNAPTAVERPKPKFVVEAEKRLRDAASGRLAGSGARQLLDLVISAGYKVYRAGMRFLEWARAVIAKEGKRVRPYLPEVWKRIQGWLGIRARAAKINAKLDPEYVDAVATFKNSTPEEVKAFYESALAKGTDHRVLIENALKKYPALTRAEAEAIYGYTTKQWYRDFNRVLENGGTPEAEQLSGLLRSGVEKMPNSTSTTQYRGIRLDSPEDIAKFDAEFVRGEVIVTKSFWSTAPDFSNAYSAQRNLVIKTDSTKDISDLAFGVNFHEMIGKPLYTSETLIPPGVKFKVTQVDADGTVFLKEIK